MNRRSFLALSIPLGAVAGVLAGPTWAGQRYNIIGSTNVMDQGRGEIVVKGGGQLVDALEVSVSGGPVTMTKVVVHFADAGIKPWSKAIRPRKDVEWTSDPIKWPSGKTRKVTKVEFRFTGTTGMKPLVQLLGLQ
jgi:hypothetical protein